jgi:transcriptional regulator of arginine metabolism
VTTVTLDQTILRLIEDQQVTDQSQFLALLRERGFHLTQPTLSRHLKKLSVMKREGRYQRVDSGASEIPPYQVTRAPPNLLVLRTRPGHAQLIGYRLDAAHIHGLMGTVAGDDTVFVAVDGDLARLEEQLRRVLDA